MCLSVIYKGKQEKEALAKLPDVMTGWATVRKEGGKYYPYFSDVYSFAPLHAGINKAQFAPARKKRISYQAGFHRLLRRKDALNYGLCSPWNSATVVRACKVKKKDIIAIGTSESMNSERENYLCVVAKQITCPKYCGKKANQ